jgi:hypothetical protein
MGQVPARAFKKRHVCKNNPVFFQENGQFWPFNR